MRQKRKRGETMVNVNRLKGVIVEKGKTQQQVAEEIGIDRSTFYRKMKDGGNFSVGEASKMAETIPLTDFEAISIFFNHVVAEKRHEENV